MSATAEVRSVAVGRQLLRVSVRSGLADGTQRVPLLLINGIGASLELLQPFVDQLDPAVEVIRFDPPGVGGSPPPGWPYRFSWLCRLIAAMLTELGYDRVDVLGISWGGGVAQHFAAFQRARCRRLVLVATATGTPMVPAGPSVLIRLATPRRYLDPDYLQRVAGDLYGGLARIDSAEIVAAMHDGLRVGPSRGYLYQLTAAAGWASLPFLPWLRQPTLILAGDDDPIIPLVNARLMHRLIRDSRLRVYHGGHLALVTEAAELAPVVDDFLAAPLVKPLENHVGRFVADSLTGCSGDRFLVMYHKLRLLGVTPVLAAIAFAPSAHAAVSENIITTLYAYPTLPSWGQVESSARTVGGAIVDICAPDGSGSGCNGQPADAENPAWPATITALQKAGIIPLYYISTNYGATSLSTIVTEMADAAMWYGVSSFLFDEMAPSGTCSDGGANIACTKYYRDLYRDSPSAKYMMFGPGTTYGTSAADIFGPKEVLQIFEGPATTEGSVTGFEETTFPAWMSGYASHYFSATLAAGTSSTIGTDISDAIKDGIGNFYETDEAEPPNYSTLPAYWSTEVTDAANGI